MQEVTVGSSLQIPVDAVLGGLYTWTITSFTSTVTGHVVVRGPKAGPIGNWDYPQGSETWYWGETTSQQGEPSFTLTLQMQTEPNDPALIAAVGEVREKEAFAGVSAMVPNWKPGAPLANDPQIVTLYDVTDGPGEYNELYYRVSFHMPIDGAPVLPTWYTEIPNLYSIFGGDPEKGAPIAVGITAKMAWSPPGEPGFPKEENWFWYGRDPK